MGDRSGWSGKGGGDGGFLGGHLSDCLILIQTKVYNGREILENNPIWLHFVGAGFAPAHNAHPQGATAKVAPYELAEK